MPHDLTKQFEALWESSDSPPDPFAFLEQHNGSDSTDKLAVLLQDQQHRWKTDQPLKVSDFDGFLNGHRYLLMDRDTKFCNSFREILGSAYVTCMRLPKRSPNLNGHMERFMRSIKEETLNRLILFGEGSLRNAVSEYLEHYHAERNHQGVGNRLLESDADVGQAAGELQQRERLGGMLRYYYRDAA